MLLDGHGPFQIQSDTFVLLVDGFFIRFLGACVRASVFATCLVSSPSFIYAPRRDFSFPHCPCMLACIAIFDHVCTLSMATPPFQSFAPLHIQMHLFGLGNSLLGVTSTNHYLCDDVYNAWSTKWAKRKLTKTSFARRDGEAVGPRRLSLIHI